MLVFMLLQTQPPAAVIKTVYFLWIIPSSLHIFSVNTSQHRCTRSIYGLEMCLRAVYHERVKTLVLHLIWTKIPVSPPTCAETALLQKNIRECISRWGSNANLKHAPALIISKAKKCCEAADVCLQIPFPTSMLLNWYNNRGWKCKCEKLIQ